MSIGARCDVALLSHMAMSPASHLNRTVYSGRTTCSQSSSSITSLSRAVRPTIVFRNDGLTNRTSSRGAEHTLMRARAATMAMITHPHIRLDDRGVAWIDGASVKVIEVVLDRLAYGRSPEEIQFQHADLSLAQTHSVLAYYYDHQSRLDAEITCQEHTGPAAAQRGGRVASRDPTESA